MPTVGKYDHLFLVITINFTVVFHVKYQLEIISEVEKYLLAFIFLEGDRFHQ